MFAAPDFSAFLLSEEDEDKAWPPSWPDPASGWFLYGLLDSETAFFLLRPFSSLAEATSYGYEEGAEDRWSEVPPEIPGTLLDSVRWVLLQV